LHFIVINSHLYQLVLYFSC